MLFLRAGFAASLACAASLHAQPVTSTPAETARPVMVVLLPAPSTVFAQPAEVLLAGLAAAHRVSGDDIALQLVEVADGADALTAALQTANDRGARIIVGPLPRASVTAVVEGQRTALPLVALNFPDSDAPAPTTMLAMALSLEAEAQRVCRLALADVGAGRGAVGTGARPRIAVLARGAPFERRIAQACMQALRTEGEVAPLVEWAPGTPGAGVASQLVQLNAEAVFLALRARDAAQVRALIPRTAQLFGTSLLYIGPPSSSPEAATLAHDLEGVRFVDMPWLLDPEHSGVAVYATPGPALTAEMMRLYALGIDAYRVASIWMKGERRFELDGVTGRLSADRTQSLRVERTPMLAVYRGGSVQRMGLAR